MKRYPFALALICLPIPAFALGADFDPTGGESVRTILVEPGQTVDDFLPPGERSYGRADLDPGMAPEGDYVFAYAFTTDGGRVLATNRRTDNVTVFDWPSMDAVANIPVGEMPGAIAVTDDYAIVACALADEAYIIDLSDYSVASVIPTDEEPWVVRVSQDQHYAYVACDLNDICTVIDLQALSYVRDISVPISLLTVYVSNESGRLWFSFTDFEVTPSGGHLIAPNRSTSIYYINTATGVINYAISGPQTPVTVELSGNGQRAIVNTAHDIAAVYQLTTSIPPSVTGSVSFIGYTIANTFDMAVNHDGSKALVSLSGNCTGVARFNTGDHVQLSTTYAPYWIGSSGDHNYAVCGRDRFSIVDFASESVRGYLDGSAQLAGAVSPAAYHAVGSDPRLCECAHFFDFSNVDAPQARGSTVTGEVPEADGPRRVAITPDGSKAVVSNVVSGNVSIVNLDTYTVEAILETGGRSQDIAITSDSRWAVVCGMLDNSVSIIDLTTNSVAAQVPVGEWPAVVDITPDDAQAWVGNLLSNTVSVVALNGAASYELTEIYGIGTIGLIWASYGVSSGLKISPDGEWCLVAASGSNQVAVLRTSSLSVATHIMTSGFPIQIDYTDNSERAMVTNAQANSALMINLVPSIPIAAGTVGANEYPLRLDYDPIHDEFGVGNYSASIVSRFDPWTGNYLGSYDYTAYGYIHDLRFDESEGIPVVVTGPAGNIAGHVHRGDDVVNLYAIPAAFDYHTPVGSNAAGEAIAVVAMPGPDYVTVIKYALAGVEEVVTVPLRAAGVLHSPQPSLVSGHTRLRFTLARPAKVELGLLDVSGRRVATPRCGRLGAGEHEVAWNAAGIPAGIYQAVLMLEGRRVDSRPVVVVSVSSF